MNGPAAAGRAPRNQSEPPSRRRRPSSSSSSFRARPASDTAFFPIPPPFTIALERIGLAVTPLSPPAGPRWLSRGFSIRQRKDAERYFLGWGVDLGFDLPSTTRPRAPNAFSPWMPESKIQVAPGRQGRRLGCNQDGPHSLMLLLLSWTPGSFCLGR